MPTPLKKAQQFLNNLSRKPLSRGERVQKAIDLAALLVEATIDEKTVPEKRHEVWLGRIVEDPKGRAFLTAMTDQVFRSHSVKRTANQLVYLIEKEGIPQFLNFFDQLKFLGFKLFGNRFPGILVPFVRRQIKRETERVLLPQDSHEQAAYIAKSRRENVRLNINHLGEAILGENEAIRRLKVYLEDLAKPQIDYVSVKISTIYSQISMVDFDHCLEILAERLRLLYNTARSHSDSPIQKFVNLDMEEYKDLDLTVAVFKKVLDEPDQLHTQAGIVLQSYLPDTFSILQDLTQWAIKRVARGGAPIKIRIVKGANLAMETVESSIKGWNLATFDQKIDTDANFKRMLEYACQPENTRAVQIGVGSHNLFDIAYAMVLRASNGVEKAISFEMLEGMAEPMRRVVQKIAGSILLYCPEAKEKDFHSSVAYLIRRLDENSGAENFLRHFFELRPGNKVWNEQKEHFIEACKRIDTLPTGPRKTQNRQTPPSAHNGEEPFKNEPDTDFSLPQNREWATQILQEWEEKTYPNIPLVISGQETERALEAGIDPSKPHSPLYFYSLAETADIDKALDCAKRSLKEWSSLPFNQRSELLGKVAQIFRERRKELIGAMVADGAKTIYEADPEVSEAIDFLEYYRKIWEKQLALTDLQWSPKGTILVAPPWNFPCSIPVSGIAAALTAGNCVLFKPAPEAVLVGWYVVQAFWDAGIPKEVLQWINCKDDPVGSYLVKHPELDSVILTGATQTARLFLRMRPGIDLHAETGGKNCIIVTAMSDRDLAVRDLITSAFGHAGQKCSACSLAILEAEVYDDPDFKRQLIDAATSLTVDSAWNPASKVTPLIRPPEGPLLRGLTTLEPGESWLVQPKKDPHNPHLWSPGIKWDVLDGGYTHQTELFGPVLGVIRATSLADAIRIANDTPYGLTSGLQSLDQREQEYWKEHIIAGNLYINRGITGAIVRRQPFGGCKASSFGSGAKAGGPNYVNQFAKPTQIAPPHEKGPLPPSALFLARTLHTFGLTREEEKDWHKSAENYAYWAEIFKEPADPSALHGEDNYFYQVPQQKAYVRIDSHEHLFPLLQVAAACLICQTPLEISSAFPLSNLATIPGLTVSIEDELTLLKREPPRIRLLSSPSTTFKKIAANIGTILQDGPVLSNGRIELPHYLREISLSFDYHRYGYIPNRNH